MFMMKRAVTSAIVVSMIAGTSAYAATPSRSAAALPGIQKAPVSGTRDAAPLKKKSLQSDEGTPVIGYGLAAIVAGGIIAATIAGTDNDSNYPTPTPDSSG